MNWLEHANRGNKKIMEMVQDFAKRNGLDFKDHFRNLCEMDRWGRVFPKTLYFGSTDGYADDVNLNWLAEQTGISVDFWKNVLFHPEDENEIPADYPTE